MFTIFLVRASEKWHYLLFYLFTVSIHLFLCKCTYIHTYIHTYRSLTCSLAGASSAEHNNMHAATAQQKRPFHAYIHTYMIPVRPSPPPPPNGSSPPPPPPVVWCGGGLLPSRPCGVVWCGCGLLPPSLWCGVVRVWALVVPPLPPLWRGVGWVVPPCMFGSAWSAWQTHAHDDFDDDDDDDNHDHHYHNHLSVSLVVGYLLPTCLLTIIALLTVGAPSL